MNIVERFQEVQKAFHEFFENNFDGKVNKLYVNRKEVFYTDIEDAKISKERIKQIEPEIMLFLERVHEFMPYREYEIEFRQYAEFMKISTMVYENNYINYYIEQNYFEVSFYFAKSC